MQSRFSENRDSTIFRVFWQINLYITVYGMHVQSPPALHPPPPSEPEIPMRHIGRLSLLLLTCWMVSCRSLTPGSAEVYHVDAERGADSNDGVTPKTAWKTLQRAAERAEPGDTVLVGPGSYSRAVLFRDGKPEAPIVFRGVNAPKISFPKDGSPVPTGTAVCRAVYNGSNARLENPGLSAKTGGFEIPGSHIRIENFEITALGNGIKSAILLKRAMNVVISGNYIHELNGGPDGFDYSDGVSGKGIGIVVRNNVFWRVEGTAVNAAGTKWMVEDNDISHGSNLRWTDGRPVCGDTDAIRFFGSGHVIRGNYLHHYLRAENDGRPHTDFIQSFTTREEPETRDILIEANTGFHNTCGQGIMIESTSYPSGKMSHITIRGNILDTTTLSYAAIVQGVPFLTVTNNVFAHSSGWGLEIDSNSHHATVLNNIFYGNKSGSGFDDDASCEGSVWDYNIHFPDYSWPVKRPQYDRNGLFGADPRFVNPGAGNYRLAPGSPAIARGIRAGALRDRDGVLFPPDSPPDIGAYYFRGDPERAGKPSR